MCLVGPRLQISPTHIRVPRVALVRPGHRPDVLVDPPVLIIEILTAEDTCVDCLARTDEYKRMGVGCTWVIDPVAKMAWVCVGRSWTKVTSLTVPGLSICVDPADIFRDGEAA